MWSFYVSGETLTSFPGTCRRQQCWGASADLLEGSAEAHGCFNLALSFV